MKSRERSVIEVVIPKEVTYDPYEDDEDSSASDSRKASNKPCSPSRAPRVGEVSGIGEHAIRARTAGKKRFGRSN